MKEKHTINDDLATSFLRLLMNEPSEAIERISFKEIQKRPLVCINADEWNTPKKSGTLELSRCQYVDKATMHVSDLKFL